MPITRSLQVPGYYRAEASPALLRNALRVLRPTLATIWIGTDAGSDGWPDELVEQVAVAAALAARQTALSRPRRPGHLATVVALNPADEDEFELATVLAGYSPLVEAMSRAGRLAVQHKGAEARLQLRLSQEERAELTSLTHTSLVPSDAPRNRDGGSWPDRFVLAMVGLSAVRFADSAAHELAAQPSWQHWLWDGGQVLVCAGVGVAALLACAVGFVRWARST